MLFCVILTGQVMNMSRKHMLSRQSRGMWWRRTSSPWLGKLRNWGQRTWAWRRELEDLVIISRLCIVLALSNCLLIKSLTGTGAYGGDMGYPGSFGEGYGRDTGLYGAGSWGSYEPRGFPHPRSISIINLCSFSVGYLHCWCFSRHQESRKGIIVY